MSISKNIDFLVNDIYIDKYSYKNVQISGVSFNTKNTQEGDVFICLPGYEMPGGEKRVDTHLLAEEAIANGAKALIAEKKINVGQEIPLYIVKDSWSALSIISARFYDYDPDYFNIIGVTGTNGKTSITYMLECILNEAGNEVGVIGTVNNRLSRKITETNNTTPEAPVIHKFLNDAMKENVKDIVIEATSHGLQLKRTESLRFDVAIFTNLTQDHLNFHLDMENYYLAKEMLFKYLLKPIAIAVINKDDPYSERIIKACLGKIVTFGIDKDAEYMAKNISYSIYDSEFELLHGNKKYFVRVPLIGKHFISNTLAAIACAHSLGIEMDIILTGIAKSVVPGRFEVVSKGQPFSVIIDFAHSPDALKNSLEQARVVKPNRVISVFGCGGDRDRKKRPIMGEFAEELSDYVIITSDNPRNEDPDQIIEEIMSGMKKSNHENICNRKEAIKKALDMAKDGDMVVILGRGHEEFQKIMGQNIPLNDKKITEELLEEKGFTAS